MSNASEHQEGATLTVQESENVLEIFCVKYGFCLTPDWYGRLADSPPSSPQAYVDAAIAAYGLDPANVDHEMHEAMQEVVRQAMARSGGAEDSLPPNTSLERTRES